MPCVYALMTPVGLSVIGAKETHAMRLYKMAEEGRLKNPPPYKSMSG
jgi:hypothetical protein